MPISSPLNALNVQVISVMISVLLSLSTLPLLLVRLYSSLPLPVRALHAKVLINCSPAVLGECAGLKRSAFILTTLFPGPVTLGGCRGLGGMSATVREKVLWGLPSHTSPAPGLLGMDLCLLPLPPPHPHLC